MKIKELLENKTYPGRGILVGKYDNYAVFAYFIMGRSENSRNRIFMSKDDIVFTKAYDESKVKDPSLIIYNAVRTIDDKVIVTNGDQTDTIYDYLKDGKTFLEALDTREYEPDSPNFTPRISSLLFLDDYRYDIGVLKKINDECARYYYHYKAITNKGHFVSTYVDDGNPLPSFDGEPIEIDVDLDIQEYTELIWNSLNYDNKISLCVRYINLDDYSYQQIIKNKNGD
ncbi:MAG: IMP cyclohydrolase [Erysipelotrichaceae bacterium]|nr:IMP cyclohydrolase [Erysipelotrichaceae bacterium]